MKILQILPLILISCVLIACTDSGPKFIVEGTISDADSSTLYLEKRELDKITILDSIRLNNKGDFKFKETFTPYPEFYVLRLNGQVINFVTDSTSALRIESSKKTFATDYTIDGPVGNNEIREIALAQYKADEKLNSLKNKYSNKEISDEQYINQIQQIATEYKEVARKIIYSDFKNPAAYFALFQKVDNYLFFDPYDKTDNKLFAAVATSWNTYFSNSPRAEHVKNYTLIAIKTIKQNTPISDDIINATQEINSTDYYNIELPDSNGNKTSLSSLRGKVVLLDFTTYQSENSPAQNIALNRIYDKYKPNIEIYQVSFDSDFHFWKNSATNLPWITVHESQSVNSDLIFKFNIQGLPTLFLLDREGNIVKRILPTDNIESEIQKVF